MKILKQAFSVLLRIGVSIVLLALLFKFNKIDLGELAKDIRGADKGLLLIGCAIFIVTYVLGFLRWRMLLKAADMHIPPRKLISSFCGGMFFSIFLPSTIGGDVVRTADLAGHTKKTKEVIATVFLDRLSGYIGLVLVVIIAFFLDSRLLQDKVVLLSVGIIIGLLVVIILVLFNKHIYASATAFFSKPGRALKVKEMIRGLHHEIHIFRHRPQMIASNLLLSLAIQVIAPISTYFIALSLGIEVKLINYFIFLPIIGAITLLPISLGGLGLRESLFALYFAKVGVSKQLAVALSLLSFSFVVLFGAIGGVIYVLTVHHRRVQHHQSPAVPRKV